MVKRAMTGVSSMLARTLNIRCAGWRARLREWTDQLLFQVQWAQLQHRHSLFVSRATFTLGLIDSPGSRGLAAVNAACSALWAGDVDTAIAGGLKIITDPDNFCQLGKGHFLSLTCQCKVWDYKVWDEAADGYCRADGVGNVVIKHLGDALADNDKILAIILAANTNHSADAISITHPHAPTQSRNYMKVMSQAGCSSLDVSYVEPHGTGTQAGDREEAKSVSDVFAPVTPRRKKKYRLRLGAVKSNIGHGGAAAGIASFIKVLLMYQRSAIPPQIGVKKLNPTLPLDSYYPSGQGQRRALALPSLTVSARTEETRPVY